MADQDKHGRQGSFWIETCPKTNFPTLKKGLIVDTVILGGGIAGITTATLLKDLGYNVALIESNRIVKDVTIGTTAKISVAPNMIYSELIKNLGKSKKPKYMLMLTKKLWIKLVKLFLRKRLNANLSVYPFTFTQNQVIRLKKLKKK